MRFCALQDPSPLRERNGRRDMVPNPAKIVDIIGARRFRTVLRRAADCVGIARTGRVS